MQRADAFPSRSMRLEVASSSLGPIMAHRFEPSCIHCKQLLGLGIETLAQLEKLVGAVGLGELKIDPATFLATTYEARVGQDADMSRNARLALPQKLRQFADGQLHSTQQRQDAQPCGVCQRLEKGGQFEVPGHGITI